MKMMFLTLPFIIIKHYETLKLLDVIRFLKIEIDFDYEYKYINFCFYLKYNNYFKN